MLSLMLQKKKFRLRKNQILLKLPNKSRSNRVGQHVKIESIGKSQNSFNQVSQLMKAIIKRTILT